MLRTGVAVEKLAHSEFAKIGSRQEALQSIFPSLLDIFYHPIFDFFQKNRLFQQPQRLSLPNRPKPDAFNRRTKTPYWLAREPPGSTRAIGARGAATRQPK